MPTPPAAKETGWYRAGAYAFNLINLEYYDATTSEIHFSGQRQDLKEKRDDLQDTLKRATRIGFVQLNETFINVRNLSSILSLGSGHGGSLTFRDGATLPISDADLGILMQAIQ